MNIIVRMNWSTNIFSSSHCDYFPGKKTVTQHIDRDDLNLTRSIDSSQSHMAIINRLNDTCYYWAKLYLLLDFRFDSIAQLEINQNTK